MLCLGDRPMCQEAGKELLFPQKQLMVFLLVRHLFTGLVIDFCVHKAVHAFRFAKVKITFFLLTDIRISQMLSNKTDSILCRPLRRRKIIA